MQGRVQATEPTQASPLGLMSPKVTATMGGSSGLWLIEAGHGPGKVTTAFMIPNHC